MVYELSNYERALVKLAIDLYYFYKGGGRRILRQGWNLWGISNCLLPKFCEPNRLEYVIEHEPSCVFLAFLLFELFPNYFCGINREEIYELLLTHDTGEALTGDIPDDGNRDEAKKDKEELDFFEWIFGRKTPQGQIISGFERLIKNFKRFQKKSTITARFAYCIDKTDAVIQSLVFEYEGFSGNIAYKMTRGVLSPRDEETMKATGSSLTADNWAESCRLNLERVDPTGKVNFFNGFIQTAIAYVRSNEFRPKEDIILYCEEHNLPIPEWCL